MELESLLTWILIPLSLLCAVWLCLPDALVLLGRVNIQRGFSGGPDDVARHPEYASEEVCREIEELGFVPLGVYWETLPGHKLFHELIYVSRERDCYAVATRLFDNDPPRVSFFSALRGASVFTQNYIGGMTADEPDLRAGCLPPPEEVESADTPASPPAAYPRWTGVFSFLILIIFILLLWSDTSEAVWQAPVLLAVGVLGDLTSQYFLRRFGSEKLPTPPPAPTVTVSDRRPLPEVLEEHRQRLQRFALAGHPVVPGEKEEDYLVGQRIYSSHPLIASKLRSAGLLTLPIKVAVLTLPPLILAFEAGPGHPATWAALLAGCFAVVLFRHYGFPLLAAMERVGGAQHQNQT